MKWVAAFLVFFQTIAFSAPNEFLILQSPDYNPGFFSVFNTVIGFLDYYEKRPGEYAGFMVDFGRRGHYFDKKKGDNWWEYYFSPIFVLEKAEKDAFTTKIPDEMKTQFSVLTQIKMDRKRGHELIQKYVKIKPEIQEKVADFTKKRFNGSFTIGVHYRGTDKETEAPKVPFKTVYEEIDKVMEGRKGVNIFVASDELSFVKDISKRYPGQVLFAEVYRSKDGKSFHNSKQKKISNYQKGEEALLDCLLLSKCDYLIRTASNLSAAAAFFNPEMPVVVLSQDYAYSK